MEHHTVQKPVFNAMALFGLLGNETFELDNATADSAVLATRRLGADFSVVTILAASSRGRAGCLMFQHFPIHSFPRRKRITRARAPDL